MIYLFTLFCILYWYFMARELYIEHVTKWRYKFDGEELFLALFLGPIVGPFLFAKRMFRKANITLDFEKVFYYEKPKPKALNLPYKIFNSKEEFEKAAHKFKLEKKIDNL